MPRGRANHYTTAPLNMELNTGHFRTESDWTNVKVMVKMSPHTPWSGMSGITPNPVKYLFLKMVDRTFMVIQFAMKASKHSHCGGLVVMRHWRRRHLSPLLLFPKPHASCLHNTFVLFSEHIVVFYIGISADRFNIVRCGIANY